MLSEAARTNRVERCNLNVTRSLFACSVKCGEAVDEIVSSEKPYVFLAERFARAQVKCDKLIDEFWMNKEYSRVFDD